MSDELHPAHNSELSEPDAVALDALMDSRLDASRVAGPLAERAGHVAALLALLEGQARIDPTLVDVTMARVQRQGAPGHIEAIEAVLSQDDAEALDAYVAAEYRAGRVASSLRPRAERIESLVRLVSQTPASGVVNGLVDRTMRRVATASEAQLEPIPIRRVGGFRFADLVSVAAVLVMGVAVLWPILSTVRGYQQKGACAANLGTVASAMGMYTGDSRDAFPVATASYGGSWMDVGTTPDRSNSANLFTLAKAGYTALKDLACPGNPTAATAPAAPGANDWRSLQEVSYSYYIMFGKNRPTPEANPKTIILADRSPVAILAATHETVPAPNWNSPNHEAKGQWALRADGTAVWLTSPRHNGDNIWLSNAIQGPLDAIQPQIDQAMRKLPKNANGVLVEMRLYGSDLPQSPDDSYLGP